MFSKFRNSLTQFSSEPAEAQPAPPSIISRDLRIVGDVHSDGELQIDGVVEGDVRAGTLLVGDTADIRGDVLAECVHVHGRLVGNIGAREVSLGETAYVTGDITHEDISIQMGAYLEGRCKRAPESVRPPQPEHARLAASSQSPGQSPAEPAITEIEGEPALDAAPARKQAGGA